MIKKFFRQLSHQRHEGFIHIPPYLDCRDPQDVWIVDPEYVAKHAANVYELPFNVDLAEEE